MSARPAQERGDARLLMAIARGISLFVYGNCSKDRQDRIVEQFIAIGFQANVSLSGNHSVPRHRHPECHDGHEPAHHFAVEGQSGVLDVANLGEIFRFHKSVFPEYAFGVYSGCLPQSHRFRYAGMAAQR